MGVTLCKAAEAWSRLLWSQRNNVGAYVRTYTHACIHVAASSFETASAQSGLDPVKPFCLSPFLPSRSAGLFLLCVIHIHPFTTLPCVFSAPQCIAARLQDRCVVKSTDSGSRDVRKTWTPNIKPQSSRLNDSLVCVSSVDATKADGAVKETTSLFY